MALPQTTDQGHALRVSFFRSRIGRRVLTLFTAEGVERPEQFEFLRHIGCDALQGYLFGRPMEADDIPGFTQRLPAPAQVDESPQLSRTGLFRRLTV